MRVRSGAISNPWASGFVVERVAAGSTPSMTIALADLGLRHLWVVHAGKDAIRLAPQVTAIPLAQVATTRLW